MELNLKHASKNKALFKMFNDPNYKPEKPSKPLQFNPDYSLKLSAVEEQEIQLKIMVKNLVRKKLHEIIRAR